MEPTDPRDKLTPIILLNGHSIKLPSKSVSFTQKTSAALRLCPSDFLVHWVVVNIETHNWLKYKESMTVECSAISRTLVEPSHARLKSHCRKEHGQPVGAEVRESWRGAGSSGHERSSALRISQPELQWFAYNQSSQSSSAEAKKAHKSHL